MLISKQTEGGNHHSFLLGTHDEWAIKHSNVHSIAALNGYALRMVSSLQNLPTTTVGYRHSQPVFVVLVAYNFLIKKQ